MSYHVDPRTYPPQHACGHVGFQRKDPYASLNRCYVHHGSDDFHDTIVQCVGPINFWQVPAESNLKMSVDRTPLMRCHLNTRMDPITPPLNMMLTKSRRAPQRRLGLNLIL